MRNIAWILALCIALPGVTPSLSRAGSAGPSDAGRIAQWVYLLGSRKFQERESAVKELEAAGPAALTALQGAERDPDPEISRRAECIVGRIQRRLETDQLLAPKHVRLQYRNTPLDEALADFSKKSGIPLDLRAGASNERITLDTGEIDFWQALDLFCRRAGLVEQPAVNYTPSTTGEVRAWNPRGGGVAQVIVISSSNAGNPAISHDGPLHFKPGTPQTLPTCYAGAVRIRALPPGAASRNAVDETTVMLEIVPQPKMGWQSLLDYTVERAVDEHGQRLTWIDETKTVPGQHAARAGNRAALLEPEPDKIRPIFDTRKVPLKFKSPPQPSKTLRQVSGTLHAQVQTPMQPLITIEDVLKSAGKTVKGRDGRSVTVNNVSQDDDGNVKMRIALEEPAPSGVTLNRRLIMKGNRVVVRNGAVIGGGIMRETGAAGESKLALVDAKGRSFALEMSAYSTTIKGASIIQDLQMTFRPHPSQHQPARFIYSDRRLVNIEIPFELKDVPLASK